MCSSPNNCGSTGVSVITVLKVLEGCVVARVDKGGRVLNTHSKSLTTMCVSDITSVYLALSSIGVV